MNPVRSSPITSNGMNIAVFCSFRDLDESYIEPSVRLIELLAKGGHAIVFGGTNTGLMKRVADTAQKCGARVTAISFERLRPSIRQDADEIIIAKDLPERKRLFMSHADAFLVLPGGLGTLDEVTEMMELKKHKLHGKRIVVYNVAGFFDGLIMQLERMERDGFLPEPLVSYVSFAQTPEDAVAALLA